MKKFMVQVILLILVIGVGIVFFIPTKNSRKLDIPFLPQQPTQSSVQINDVTLKVEVADTQSKRSKGLGGRQSLAEFEGMLFVFDKADKHPFWMKGLSFPLDFIWIREDKVVDITENVPTPTAGQSDADLPIYSSKVEADKVLELNALSVKKFNIKVGDSVKLIRT